jgi:SAM-dependent methyltransferase
VQQDTALQPYCLVCGSAEISPALHLRNVPVHCNIQWPTREAATAAPKGDIRLGLCRECGHIFNVTFDAALTAYGEQYDNSLHYSSQFNAYAQRLAQRLIDKYNVRDSTVLEIGCGKGEFLAMLCRLGHNRGYGFDPSYEPGREIAPGAAAFLKFVPDFYTEKYSEYKARLICCRHVLEHLPNPNAFVADIRSAVGNDVETALYFEVPSMKFIVENHAVWDVIYEHCSYFSPGSVARLLKQNAFKVTTLYEDFSNQYLCVDVACDQSAQEGIVVVPKVHALADLLVDLDRKYQGALAHWRHWFRQAVRDDRRVVIWGAGSKGVTFLNLVGANDVVQYAVDVNPYKQGKFVAGTGQEIVPPEFLKEHRPDHVVVMNDIYKNEIDATLTSLAVTAEVVSVQSRPPGTA